MKDIFLFIQKTATSDDLPMNDLEAHLDTNYPNIGDQVNTDELKEYLSDVGYYGEDLRKTMRLFTKNPEAFDFEFVKKTTHRYQGKVNSIKIFRRIKDPLLQRVSA